MRLMMPVSKMLDELSQEVCETATLFDGVCMHSINMV